MPLYSEEYIPDLSLHDELEKLAEKYGAKTFHQVLQKFSWLEPYQKTIKLDKAVLLDEAVDYFYSSDAFFELSPSSQQIYRYEIEMFLTYCKKEIGDQVMLREIANVRFLAGYLQSVKKINTKSKKSSILRTFLSTVFEHFYDEKIDKLKKRALPVKVDKNQRPRAFKSEQIEELLNLVRLGKESYRNYVILWTFLGTGIRLSELTSLQVGDIRPDFQEILVYAKGDKKNKVPRKITKYSLGLLLKYVNFRYQSLKDKSHYPDLYVFSDDKGKSPLHDSTIQKMLQGLIQEATLIPKEDKKPYHLSVHSIRHSFALYLLESGVNIYMIKDLLGHQWLSSTLVYLKLFDDMLVDVINKHPLGNLKIEELY